MLTYHMLKNYMSGRRWQHSRHRRTSQKESLPTPAALTMLLRMRTCMSPSGLACSSASARPQAVEILSIRRATPASRSPRCSSCCCGGSGTAKPPPRSAAVRRVGHACCTAAHCHHAPAPQNFPVDGHMRVCLVYFPQNSASIVVEAPKGS